MRAATGLRAATFLVSLLALAALAACAQAPSGTHVAASHSGRLVPGTLESPAALVTPDQMVGLSVAEVTGLFGTPSLERHDAPVEILQYADTDCVLLVFLYQSDSGDYRVRHAETRTGTSKVSAARPSSAQCLSRLKGGRGVATALSTS